MQKLRVLALTTVVLIGGLAFYWSEIAWITVQFTDTSEAYAEFVSSYPESRHHALGTQRLEELEWRHATRFGGVLGYQRYLAWVPDGQHVEEARQGLDDATWREAQEGGSRASIENYQAAYPEGRNAALALQELENIAWDAAKLQDTRAAYVAFLEQYPQGAHAEAAHTRVQAEVYWAAFQTGKVEPLVAFIESNPPAELLTDAHDQLDDLYWDLAVEDPTIESLTRFLAQARGDEHRADALYQLDNLTWVAAGRERTREAVETYLEGFPAGQYVDPALDLLAEIDLSEALAEGTAEAVRDYVSAHPESVDRGGVQSQLEASLWSKAEDLDSIQGYESYLQHFAQGVHAAAAERALQGRPVFILLSLGLIEVDVVAATVGEVVVDVRLLSTRTAAPSDSESPGREPASPEPIGVTVDLPGGTLLRPTDETATEIITLEDARVRVSGKGPQRVRLRAVCLADARIADDTSYSLEASDGGLPPGLLARMLLTGASIQALQLATWVVVGDATLLELQEPRFRLPEPFPFDALAEGLDVLGSSGFDVTKRRIWLDRATLGAALSSGESGRVREWLSRPTSVGDALRFGTLDQLRRLLESGASPHRFELGSKEDLDPLRLAIQLDRMEHGRVLLEAGASVNTGRGGEPPLTQAVAMGSADWVRLLIGAGGLPNQTRSPHNAFSLAAASDRVELLQLLFDAGAKIDGFGSDDSPLQRAITEGHAAAASFLLEHGARLDLGTEDKSAAVNLAAFPLSRPGALALRTGRRGDDLLRGGAR